MRKALEPYIKLAPFVGIGLVVVAIAVTWILYMQRGAHIELTGSVQKVRTLALDEKSSAAILDFRITNPSDYTFLVRTVEVSMVDRKDQTLEGAPISDVDARRLFEYFPLELGQRYNDSLIMRTKIAPRQTIDRMLAVRFEVPRAELDARKQLRLHIREVSGPVADLVETKSAP